MTLAAAPGLEPILAQAVSTEALFGALVGIAGFALLAGGTAAGVAFVFRWYSADGIPEGVAILLGVSMVAIWLNAQSALQQVISGDAELLELSTVAFTVAAFVASAIAADGGRRLGDHLATDVFAVATPRTITEVGQLVRSAGRVVAVELPEEIADVDGYDSVEESTKTELAGHTLLFPRRLSTDDLRERLIARLERDYGIGHVDVEFGTDRTIDYLALGSRPAGIGSTLAPGTVAVAIRGDPAPDASPGDAVRIWRRDEDSLRRAAGGELRGVADDVATVAVDADDAGTLSTDEEYRLVTLPRDPGAERDLVSLLRAADETVTTLPVDAGDPLEGAAVGSLPVFVLAVDRGAAGADPLALPSSETRLEAGDVAYVLGRPDALRRIGDLERPLTADLESDADAEAGASSDADSDADSDAATDPTANDDAESVDGTPPERTRER
ncbi:TrkA C-terminal domain-containing protein [Haloterrigena sp. SYSU A121-1]|uniref:TrkA C-terminal domain-containing protein n=1 Tax=Haloterrigena gelatinilytica TaxID=2741724 RepID=A0A8J8GK45_9EURY|nr:TrkA C-terminal domain-containing protein [Haloterrigena gelatinilytica]NUB90705.1 TrkA C-terminal domain-containing protein [Haloterrigena gelatinilytica]